MKNPTLPKILLLTKENHGGMGTFLEQINKLKTDEYELFFGFYKKHPFSPTLSNAIYLNSNYPVSENISLNKVLIFLVNIYKTRQLINKLRPDLILVLDPYAQIIVLVLKRLFPKILFMSLFYNNVYAALERKPFLPYCMVLKWLIKKIGNTSNKIIFASNDLADFYINKFSFSPKKTVVIHPGVRVAQIKKESKVKIPRKYMNLFERDKYKIMSIGRFDSQKDFQTIIKAFDLINRFNPRTILYLIGDGINRHKLLNLTKQLNVADKVVFLGWHKNIFHFLKLADVFVYASFYDGLPTVLLEAMSLKVPIVATDSPCGPREIFEKQKCGLLVPVGNPGQMADAVNRLIRVSSFKSELVRSAYSRVKDFSERDMLDQFDKLFCSELEV